MRKVRRGAGQRVSIKYGNDVETRYRYDPKRRWLSGIETKNRRGLGFDKLLYLNYTTFFLYDKEIMEVLVLENSSSSEKDRSLRQKAVPIKDINEEVREIARKMMETMYSGKGVGLAGPQVGFLKRIFVTNTEKEGPMVFINPSIIWTSHEQVNCEEGCLSLPGMYADVRRPEKIRVQAWNEKGRVFNLEVSGLLARVIQHENDHLEGILFIDRIDELKRQKLLIKLKKHTIKTKNRKSVI